MEQVFDKDIAVHYVGNRWSGVLIEILASYIARQYNLWATPLPTSGRARVLC
jgi:hypothetical protein